MRLTHVRAFLNSAAFAVAAAAAVVPVVVVLLVPVLACLPAPRKTYMVKPSTFSCFDWNQNKSSCFSYIVCRYAGGPLLTTAPYNTSRFKEK